MSSSHHFLSFIVEFITQITVKLNYLGNSMKTVHLLWLYIYKIICNVVIPKHIERQKTDTCNEYLDNNTKSQWHIYAVVTKHLLSKLLLHTVCGSYWIKCSIVNGLLFPTLALNAPMLCPRDSHPNSFFLQLTENIWQKLTWMEWKPWPFPHKH